MFGHGPIWEVLVFVASQIRKKEGRRLDLWVSIKKIIPMLIGFGDHNVFY